MRFLITIFFLLIFNSISFSLTIDTNILDTNKVKMSESITNSELKKVIEPSLPNSFLNKGNLSPLPLETIGRRFDLVYYIAIPITFYLLLNVMQIKNLYAYQSRPLDNTDFNYIYLNIMVIPLSVAYYDNRFMAEQQRIKEEMAYRQPLERNSLTFSMNIYSIRF